MIQVFTDGGCRGNPGPGGWAYIVKFEGGERSFCGGEIETTNNRMELRAVIEALREIIKMQAVNGLSPTGAADAIEVFTDSQYVQKGISEWIHGWMRNGWKTAAKDPVKNKELWQELWNLSRHMPIDWKWLKGHAGHPENEACDALVQTAIDNLKL